MSWEVRPVTKEEASAALREVAFVAQDEGSDESRTLVHSFRHTGPIALGADADLAAALFAVETADEIAWVTHPLRHDLTVRVGDRVTHYNCLRPERDE